jgi:hypothetical protein
MVGAAVLTSQLRAAAARWTSVAAAPGSQTGTRVTPVTVV